MSEVLGERCEACHQPAGSCVCAGIQRFANRHFLLILQHPQEQDRELGSARLALRHLQNGALRVGLSWPNLAKALGRPAADPRRWATLYLGAWRPEGKGGVAVLGKDGTSLPDTAATLSDIEGVIALDGTWSQAKTLWWRNPWLVKTRRIALDPVRPSRYGRLRREPRREGLSTLEAIAMLLATMEDAPKLEAAMLTSFEAMLAAHRARAAGQGAAAADGGGG